MKIEFEIEQLDTRMGELISAFEGSECEGTVTRFTLSGESQEPDAWLSEERKKAFEEKLNESALGKDGLKFKLLSVRKIFTSPAIKEITN